MRQTKGLWLLALTLMACWTLASWPLAASSIVYDDRTLWEASTPGFINIDFEGLTSNYTSYNNASGLVLRDVQFLGITYAPTIGYQLWVTNPLGGSPDFGSGSYLKGPIYFSNDPGREIKVTLPPNINSFGVELMTVGTSGELFAIALSTGEVFQRPTSATGRTFFGINSDIPITSISFRLLTGTNFITFPLLDNFAYGIASLNQNPSGPSGEPQNPPQSTPEGGETAEGATLLLVGTGLLILNRLRQRDLIRVR